MHKKPFKLTPEQMQAQSKPLASSARDRLRVVAALLACVLLQALAACGGPNEAKACHGTFRIGESEAAMKADFPYPNQTPDHTIVVAGTERKIYDNPCKHGKLIVENGHLVGWTQ